MNCWLLCLPRSGSTFLCDLLNETGVFPVYNDTRLKNNIGPIQKGRAFNEWLRIFSNYNDLRKNPPPCCKAIYHQYIEVMGELPLEKRRKPSKFYLPIDKKKEEFVKNNFKLDVIQKIFQDIKFINLKRDILEQSVSTYFARQTNTYHIYDKKQADNYFKNNIKIDDDQLFKVYEEISLVYNSWNDLLSCSNQCLEIYYEDIVKNPDIVLLNILNFMKVKSNTSQLKKTVDSVNAVKRIYRMTRPESKKAVLHLKNLIKIKEFLNCNQKIFL